MIKQVVVLLVYLVLSTLLNDFGISLSGVVGESWSSTCLLGLVRQTHHKRTLKL